MNKVKIAHTPPNNIEAEQAVLASITIDTAVIDELVGYLDVEDFYHTYHKNIYKAFLELHRVGKPLDLVTLISQLQDDKTLDASGGIEYLAELVQIIPNSANIMAYANSVREKALLRKMVTAGGLISEMGFNTFEPIETLIDNAQSIIYKLGENRLKSDAEHISGILSNNYARLEKLYSMDIKDKNVSGITSGFTDLDLITNGFQRSDLIIVAGRPAMGKTSFGLNIMLNAAYAGHSCVFFTLEMSPEQLVNRIISCEAEIELAKLRTGDMNRQEWEKLSNFSAKLDKLDIYIDDTDQITVNQIRSRCRRLKQRGHLDIIFVDYLQIMGVNKSLAIREQQISEISRALKALAKELDVPVMAFAQVSRAVDARVDNHRPYLSDLRESGAIEQDADIIMFLYRDSVYNKESLYNCVAEVIVAKHRNGRTDTVYLSFDSHFTRFGKRPIDKAYLPKVMK